MYISKINIEENKEDLLKFIAGNSFGLLITINNENKSCATHIPFTLKKNSDNITLESHISIVNPQCADLNENKEVLVVFSGPHAFISSSWYDHVNVNTWNYQSVHIYGKVKILNEEQKLQSVKEMTDFFDQKYPNSNRVEDMPQKFVASHLKGILAFQIEATEIQASSKLSQNRDEKNYNSIVKNLSESENEMDNIVSEIMKNKRK